MAPSHLLCFKVVRGALPHSYSSALHLSRLGQAIIFGLNFLWATSFWFLISSSCAALTSSFPLHAKKACSFENSWCGQLVTALGVGSLSPAALPTD